MKIRELDNKSVREISQEIKTALTEIGELYGIRFTMGNVRFSSAEFSTKITAQVNNTEVLAEAYSMELKMLGLPPDTIGRYFEHRGEYYHIQSVIMRKRKYPIVCGVIGDSRRVAFEAATIKRLLDSAPISEEVFVKFGLPRDAYGKVFKYGGEKFKIAFVNERDEEYPIMCINITNNYMEEFDASSVSSYPLEKDSVN